MYDYVSEPPPFDILHAPVVPRAAHIPSSPAHISPQPEPAAYMAPTTREITRPSQQPRPVLVTHDPNEESDPLTLPTETIRTDQARRQLGVRVPTQVGGVISTPVPVRSPPLVHAADYPLETPIHGDLARAHEDCWDRGEHMHNFDASLHPP
jgi:hypothetical protein